MERIETTILRNLIYNEEYSRKVIPFIKPEYFESRSEKVIFEEITQFIVKYNSSITIEALNIETENRTDLTEDEIKDIRDINSSFTDAVVENQWLIDSTEKWCRDRAIYLALMESIHIADGNDEKKNRDAIPSILSDALAVSFDNHIGHDYLNDYEEDMNRITGKKIRSRSTLNFLTRLRKVVYLIKLSTLLLLAQGLERVYLCATWLAVSSSKEKTFSTSLSKWQRRRLRRGSMLIYLMSIYRI